MGVVAGILRETGSLEMSCVPPVLVIEVPRVEMSNGATALGYLLIVDGALESAVRASSSLVLTLG